MSRFNQQFVAIIHKIMKNLKLNNSKTQDEEKVFNQMNKPKVFSIFILSKHIKNSFIFDIELLQTLRLKLLHCQHLRLP